AGRGERRLPQGEHVVDRLDPLPAVVPVHGVVASGEAGDGTAPRFGEGLLDQGEGRGGAFRRRVAAIEEAVQIDAPAAPPGGEADGGGEVFLVAVDPAGGQQAEDVHRAIGGEGLVHGGAVHRVGEEVPVGDCLVDAGEALVDHPPGAEGHVPHLG